MYIQKGMVSRVAPSTQSVVYATQMSGTDDTLNARVIFHNITRLLP